MAGRRLPVVLLAAATLACSVERPRESDRPLSYPGANVALVSLDTTRRDRLSVYGAARSTSPALEALAAESAVFDQAIASFTQTAPAHASIFTGLPASLHGVGRNGVPLGPVPTTLAETLRARGYHTGGFVSSWTMTRHTGLDRGFAVWEDGFPADPGARRAGADTLALAEGWLEEVGSDPRPFLLFLHLFEPHWPYDPPPDIALAFLDGATSLETAALPTHIPRLREANRLGPAQLAEYGARYDGELVVVDRLVGRFLARLETAGVGRDTLVVVVADHGETLFERDWMMDHGARVHDEQIRVPLLLRFPDRRWSGRRVADQVSHVDLLPTVLDALDLPSPDGICGRSLLPLLHGDPRWSPRPAFSAAVCIPRRYPHLRARLLPDGQVHAVRLPGWKLVEYPTRDGGWTPELFDLTADPGETRNLVSRRPDDARRLHLLLEAWRARADDAASADEITDPEVLDALRELGYLD